MTSRSSRSIELFFVDGSPGGMVTATIPFQWTGHVLVFSRTQIVKALKKREEAKRSGVYMLVGEMECSPRLYVGQGDEIRNRIRSHAEEKDWWSTAILITSSGETLNTAHTRYLERKLYDLAARLKKIELDNENTPPSSPLSEAARAHMDGFMENIPLVLSALRFDFLTEDTEDAEVGGQEPSAARGEDGDPVYFMLKVPGSGARDLEAHARVENGRFIVEAGSCARKEWTGTSTRDSTYATLFRDLVGQGILVKPESPDAGYLKFEKSYIFKSSSAAASVVTGTQVPGPTYWKLRDNTEKTYREWEKENLDSLIDGKGTPE